MGGRPEQPDHTEYPGGGLAGNGGANQHRQLNANRTITGVQCACARAPAAPWVYPQTRNGQSNQQWSLG